MKHLKLFCGKCGLKVLAACTCGVAYVPARAAAMKAVTANPERSDRAIAKELGVDHKTIGAARKEMNGEISPVDKRIGRDGKARRLPGHSDDLTLDEIKHVPNAANIVARLMPTMKALTKEAKCHATNISPSSVGRLVYDLLNEIFENPFLAPRTKAKVCGDVARNWEIQELNKELLDAVAATSCAWTDLAVRMMEAAAAAKAAAAAGEENAPAPREMEVTT
jgi:hypothetical protein